MTPFPVVLVVVDAAAEAMVSVDDHQIAAVGRESTAKPGDAFDYGQHPDRSH